MSCCRGAPGWPACSAYRLGRCSRRWRGHGTATTGGRSAVAAHPAEGGARARRRRQPWIEARRILRHTLTRQRRVGVTLPVVAVVERDVLLVAFAQLDRRRTLPGLRFARNVAHTTDIEVRVLRHPAVQLTGGPLGASSSEGDRCCWTGRNPVLHGGGRLRLRLKSR